jgi:hypothetical protein
VRGNHCIALGVTLLLLIPLTPSAQATACLGQGLTAEDFTPKGTTEDPNPAVWALFRWQVRSDDWTYWYCFDSVMRIDGADVPTSVSGNWINGAIFIQYAGPQLSPGLHSVYSSVTSKDGLSSAELAWSFVISCGQGLSPTGVTPSGGTSDAAPEITASFQDGSPHCGLASFYMNFDGASVPASASLEGSNYVVRWTPAQPLAPGPHVVQAGVEENCCSTSGTQERADVAWTFIYAPGLPIAPGTFLPGEEAATPDAIPIDETCVPLLICVGPSTLDLPAGVALELEPTTGTLFADPLHTTPLGPITVVLPTPGTGTPVTLCPTTCPEPAPGTWGELHTGVHATVRLQDTEVPVDRDVDIVLP